jgi:spore germination protein YaaH
MIDDFLRFVPAEKLTVIFGMYGYDWRVDEKKRPITSAKALTLAEIKNKFLNNENDEEQKFKCRLKNCIIRRDSLAKEMEINYTISAEEPDAEGIYRIDYHIVWYEDEESVATKMKFLEEKGIGSIAYWAYKYF